jgi:hypothetical protein
MNYNTYDFIWQTLYDNRYLGYQPTNWMITLGHWNLGPKFDHMIGYDRTRKSVYATIGD